MPRFKEIKTIANISDHLKREIGVECFCSKKEVVIEIILGEDSSIDYPLLNGSRVSDVFFHTHNLGNYILSFLEGQKEAILPGHDFGDIDLTLTKTYQEAIRTGNKVKNPGGINIITSKGITFFVGHRDTLILDNEFYDWSIQNTKDRNFRFNSRDDRNWTNSHISLEDSILFKYRTGDWQAELYFLFIPWDQLLMFEEKNLVSLEEIVYGEGIKVLKELLCLKQPFALNLVQAIESLNFVVAERGREYKLENTD